MKKILMGIIIFFLLLLIFFMITGRVSFGNNKILGIEDIKNESKKLDDKIAEISKLTTVTYEQKKDDLSVAQKTMKQSKEEYEDKLIYSTDSEIMAANRLENYNIEFLWTRIGKYATAQGLTLKLEVQNGTSSDLKNLVFSATGKYIPMTDFVYSLENDDELGFTIESFKLVPSSSDGSELLGTFTVSDIATKVNAVTSSASSLTNETSNTTKNTTKNTAKNTTTNTTNTASNTTKQNTTTNIDSDEVAE